MNQPSNLVTPTSTYLLKKIMVGESGIPYKLPRN